MGVINPEPAKDLARSDGAARHIRRAPESFGTKVPQDDVKKMWRRGLLKVAALASGGVGVNRDAVIADFGLYLLSICVGEKQFGILQGHVAVNTIAGDLLTQFVKLSAIGRLVARKAMERE